MLVWKTDRTSDSFLFRSESNSPSGQSTVEFALTSIFLLMFILFFIQLSLVFAYGNYVHYATFMSARALLSAGPDEKDQVSRARQILILMLKQGQDSPDQDRWPALGQAGSGPDQLKGATIGEYRGNSPRLQFSREVKSKSWLEGVRYNFRSRLFLIPTAGRQDPDAGLLDLTSESFLLRESSYDECIQDFADRIGPVGEQSAIDNGC